VLYEVNIVTLALSAKQTCMQNPPIPIGAIYLDELILRYLVAIGLRQFGWPRSLTREEATQFAFLSFYRVYQSYALIKSDQKNFLDSVMSGVEVPKICLLPDTPEAQKYLKTSDEPSVLFYKVANVKGLIRKVFLNLIIDEIKNEKNQELVKEAITLQHAPLRRRLTKDGKYQSLETYAQNIHAQGQATDKKVLTAELLVLARECLGNVKCDLLLAYYEGGIEHFQALHFRYTGKQISTAAARKSVTRCLYKLTEYIQKKTSST
jgi:hypothetical protein